MPVEVQTMEPETTINLSPEPSQDLKQDNQSQEISQSQPEEKKESLFDRIKKVEGLHKQTRTELDQERKKLEEQQIKLKKYEELEELSQKNPIELMEKLGWSYDKLTKLMLDKDKDPHLKELHERLDRMEKDKEETKQKEIEEKNKILYSKLIDSIDQTIKENDYDLIDKLDYRQEIVQHMTNIYNKFAEEGKPKVISFKDACEDVNNKVAADIKALKKSKWLREKEEEKRERDNDSPSTLTNKMSQTSSKVKNLTTEEERIEAAIRLAKNMRLQK